MSLVVRRAGLGAVYVQMRKFAEARPYLEDALAFDPSYAEAHFFLAETLVAAYYAPSITYSSILSFSDVDWLGKY